MSSTTLPTAPAFAQLAATSLSYEPPHDTAFVPPSAVTDSEDLYSYEADLFGVVVGYNLSRAAVQAYLDEVFGAGVFRAEPAGRGALKDYVSAAVVISEQYTNHATPGVKPRFGETDESGGDLFPFSVKVTYVATGQTGYLNAGGVIVTDPLAMAAGQKLNVAKGLWDDGRFGLEERRGLFWASVTAYLQKEPFLPGLESVLAQTYIPDADQRPAVTDRFSLSWRGFTLPVFFPESQTFFNVTEAGAISSLTAVSERRWGRLGLWNQRASFAVASFDKKIAALFNGQKPVGVILRRDFTTITADAPLPAAPQSHTAHNGSYRSFHVKDCL